MKKTSTVIVSLVLLSVLVFFSVHYFWKNRYEYFFQGEQPFELKQIQEKRDETNQTNLEEDDRQQLENDKDRESSVDRPNKEYKTPTITTKDCDNDCKEYDDKNELIYCQEICGFSEPVDLATQEGINKTDEENVIEDECEYKKDLEKDTCYKWKAVREKNSAYCDQISDESLAESCQNRVIEEIFQ